MDLIFLFHKRQIINILFRAVASWFDDGLVDSETLLLPSLNVIPSIFNFFILS